MVAIMSNSLRIPLLCARTSPSAAAELCPKSALEPSIRCNVLVAMGDLAFRFPNVLEPYTSAMYQPLTDPDLCECAGSALHRMRCHVYIDSGKWGRGAQA